MKKTLYHKYIAMLIVLLAILPCFLVIGAFVLPCQYEDTFLGELKYKYERLQNTSGNRIVLVGGSSVVFGTDSVMLEEELKDYSVVDFGMYAALGTTVMLDLSEDEIRAGDIVIISPEQNEQTLTDYFNAEMMWHGVDGAYYLLPKLDRDKLGKMTGEFPYFAIEKWSYFWNGDAPQPEGVYRRQSFNNYGDIASAECEKNIMQEGYDTNQSIDFAEDYYDDAFINRVNEYVDTLTERGATVWYRFPPMNSWAVENREDVDSYYERLSQKLHCEIIGNPNDCIMEPEWFYDTNFHLNNSGKTKNTYQMIRDIKAMLGNSTVTEILPLEAPEFAVARSFKGNDEDADCFVYEIMEDRQWIVGLTEKGQEKKSLIIPSNANGQAVSGIRKEALKDNTKLEQITIQKNITALEDAMFEGCTNLKKIYLQDVKPEQIQVGQNLLQGTSATIYVEPELVSEYKTNYSWSLYGTYILAKK